MTVVAQVIKINPQATNITYDLDDGTGQIQARHWVDPSQSGEDDDIKCALSLSLLLSLPFSLRLRSHS